MKMKQYPSFDAYYADQTRSNQSVIRALRKVVKSVAPELKESVKWGNGCWLRDASPVCYVYSASDHVQFGFFRGSALSDPKGLLRGNGRYVRHIRLGKPADLDVEAAARLLRQA